VVTNVEFDHADIYRDAQAYRFAFERFVNLVPRTGTLVVGWETPVAREVAQDALAPVASVGLEEDEGPGDEVTSTGSAEEHLRWLARNVEYGRDGTTFELVHDGEPMGTFETRLSGGFNVRNCLCAIAAARASGASWEGIREGLATFRSPRRRMEVRGEIGGVTVIDDFAHHPTAVRGTIDAARQRWEGGRVIAIFEPRSYTAQRREFQEAYRRAFAGADRVVLAGLFRPERYDEETGMDPRELADQIAVDGTPAEHEPDVEAIVRTVVADARVGDVLLVMSNGGFGGIHEKLLEALEGREGR
jgi:UDP-N-acetylmuramate: L-alanyl-gamma-D-glutamyl-meso-diaminopimelate ligase